MPCIGIIIVCPFFSPAALRLGIYFDAGILCRCSHTFRKLSAQPASSERAPWNNPQALIYAGGNEFPFSLTVKQVIKRLQTTNGFPMHCMTDINSFLKLPAAEIADAKIKHFS